MVGNHAGTVGCKMWGTIKYYIIFKMDFKIIYY